MRSEFITVLTDDDDLREVRYRLSVLKDQLLKINGRIKWEEDNQIERDYRDAQAIVEALRGDPERPAYKIAAACLEEAKREVLSADEERDRREALRRKITLEGIQALRQSDLYFAALDKLYEEERKAADNAG